MPLFPVVAGCQQEATQMVQEATSVFSSLQATATPRLSRPRPASLTDPCCWLLRSDPTKLTLTNLLCSLFVWCFETDDTELMFNRVGPTCALDNKACPVCLCAPSPVYRLPKPSYQRRNPEYLVAPLPAVYYILLCARAILCLTDLIIGGQVKLLKYCWQLAKILSPICGCKL